MKVALGQINPKIGDFSGNRRLICSAAEKALKQGAELIVFPELCICGYPPMDLLHFDSFLAANEQSVSSLLQELPHGIAVLVGYAERGISSKHLPIVYNTAAVLLDGKILHRQAKTLLPTYDVFDEARYFTPAAERKSFELFGRRFGIAICEDLWLEDDPLLRTAYQSDPVRELVQQGVEIILCPSASPFAAGKIFSRKQLLQKIGRSGIAVIYSNCTGANDALIFDGRSMISDYSGRIITLAEAFNSCVTISELPESAEVLLPDIDLQEDRIETQYKAIVLGIRDYMAKSGFRKVHIGLSGGIDSALVAVLAAEAVGAENLTCLLLPSRYSSSHSLSDAEALARNLGCRHFTIGIHDTVDAMEAALKPLFQGMEADLTEENIQARTRGSLLMAFSNKFGSLLLNTGNKSELAVGYCTLYGDMNGSLSVIADLFKTEVYTMCRWINRDREIIPESIITKAPSAELRPDQKDQDSLPEYEELDTILEHYLIRNMHADDIIAAGHDTDTVHKVIGLTARSEYKRFQAAPVLKVSTRAFGSGRRIPIARSLSEL
ncbi:NAD+ synthase [Spirochaeta dissipatitropha]